MDGKERLFVAAFCFFFFWWEGRKKTVCCVCGFEKSNNSTLWEALTEQTSEKVKKIPAEKKKLETYVTKTVKDYRGYVNVYAF